MDVSRTTTALLEGLLTGEDESLWNEVSERYRPVLHAWAMRMGLDREDAADVVQETLLRFVRDYRRGRYDRDRGRLRSWIFSIARHRLIDSRQARGAHAELRSESALGQIEGSDPSCRIWEEEWERAVTQRAMEALQRSSDFDARTLRAFRLYALEGVAAEQVARELELSVRAVYLAKHRCAKRLRSLVEDLLRALDS